MAYIMFWNISKNSSFENISPAIQFPCQVFIIMFFQDQVQISFHIFMTQSTRFLQDQQSMIYDNLRKHHETNTISWLWKFPDDSLGKYRQNIYDNKRRKWDWNTQRCDK